MVGVVVALAGAGLGLGWALWARISVYASTEKARLEAFAAPHALQAPVAGKVVETYLELGRAVHAGDPLLLLDADREKLELEEARQRLGAIPAQIAAVRAQRVALEEELRAARGHADATRAQAEVNGQAAAAALHTKTDELERKARLGQGEVSELELARVRDEKRSLQAAVDARALDKNRIGWELKNEEARIHLRIEEAGREISELEGRQTAQRASVARLEHEVNLRVLRAPVEGVLAAVPELRLGGYVKEGEPIGTVVPSGGLRVVAQFAPAAALGRVRPGQRALLRLHGFPWPQFSPVEAIVSSVAMEPRSGEVRVELAVRDGEHRDVPLEHGLPGTLEVEVERASPLSLVLRAAGRVLHGSPSTGP